MKEIKSLGDILGTDDNSEELYTTDQRKRHRRAQKGRFTRQEGIFSFIHLIKAWEEIVGKMMASNTTPLKIRNKQLIISTKHSIFANELSFLIPKIIEKIHLKFPELGPHVTGIKFMHSKVSSRDVMKPNQSLPKERKVKKLHPYSPEFIQKKVKAESLFSDIEDEEVRKALTDFLLQS